MVTHPAYHKSFISVWLELWCSSYRSGNIQDCNSLNAHRLVCPSVQACSISNNIEGTKFVLLVSLNETNSEALLQKVYEIYADIGMKNPFYTPEMPIRNEKFDTRIGTLLSPR